MWHRITLYQFFPLANPKVADKVDVFICPECNCEVEEPGFKPAAPWWKRRRGTSSRPVPICDRGHKLRNQIIGDHTELPLPWAFLRGLFACSLTLLLGILSDMRSSGRSFRGLSHLSVIVVTGSAAVFGMMALSQAWTWLGVRGPASRPGFARDGFSAGFPIAIRRNGLGSLP